jgi:hypothetical protein
VDANAVTPLALFDGKVIFEIPAFQRPYVWTEEDQWQPLWDDVARLVEAVTRSRISADRNESPRHFLGAVVLKQLASESGDPLRRSVIDGQQRLTTLQILLDAAQGVVARHGLDEDAESLKELVANSADRFQRTHKRFKLRPSRGDREAFESVMGRGSLDPVADEDAQIVKAHRFFTREIEQWAEVDSRGTTGSVEGRLADLAGVLQDNIQLVAIDLETIDDEQLIFETLNDRGTPLLAADLIKNFVFQRCEDLGVDVEAWVDRYWHDFDSDWWREEVAQGRQFRSRIDLFMQYWLTMLRKEEVATDRVFRTFRELADEELREPKTAKDFLVRMRSDADGFREFAQLDQSTAIGSFYGRVVEGLELGVFIPLLLWVISTTGSHRHGAERALKAVESWAVRRTLLRRTMKDVNRLVVTLLKELDKYEGDGIGQAAVDFLLAQTADSRTWPSDQELISELPDVRAYGNIKQQRLRTILAGVELSLRTAKHEQFELPGRLHIEHVMPKGWRSYWQPDAPLDEIAARERDRLVDTIGNLTLVTKNLNSSLSNRPWTDADAAPLAKSRTYRGLGKRSLLREFSLLALNNQITEANPEAWTEDDIETRSMDLAQRIAAVWPHG